MSRSVCLLSRLAVFVLLFSILLGCNDAKTFQSAIRTDTCEEALPFTIAPGGPVPEVPVTTEDYYNRAVMFHSKGDFERAIADYSQAIKLKPDYVEALEGRGWAYGEQGNYDASIVDFNEAIRLNPTDPLVYSYAGWAYRCNDNYYASMRSYDKSIQLRHTAEAYTGRGLTRYNNGEYPKAVADFTEAIGLAPDSAPVYYSRALAFQMDGEYSLAIADYTEAIRLKPDYALAHYKRARLYGVDNEQAAIMDYERVIELSTDPKLKQAAEEELKELKAIDPKP